MKPQKNTLEWIVFAGSALLIAALAGALLREAIISKSAPAALSIEAGEPIRSANGHQLPVTIRNGGDKTAEDVSVEVLLMSGTTVEERAVLHLPFVPRKSSRPAWVAFRTDPAGHTIAMGAVTFNEP